MGHGYQSCGRTRPNERFSGKGHRTHVCQDCARPPKPQRDAIDQAREVSGYLTQSRISEQNLARLRTPAAQAARSVAELAAVVIAVAEIPPGPRSRGCGSWRARATICGRRWSGPV